MGNLDKVNDALNRGVRKNVEQIENIPEELPLEVTTDEEEEMSEEEYQEFMRLQYEILAIPPTEVVTVINPINPNKKCGSCQFFAEDTRVLVRSFLEESVPFVAGVRYGRCQAEPPTVDIDCPVSTGVFPVVPEYLWCGKWDLTAIPQQVPVPMEEATGEDLESLAEEADEDLTEAEMPEETPDEKTPTEE